MLETLRRHSQSYLVYVFFGVIIVVFVFFFGPQSDGCSPSQATTVATVGGRDVLSLQLEQLYAQVEVYERGIPDEQRLGPGARRRQLAEDIVLVRLLAADARAAGLSVSDEQFAAYIRDPQRNPDFRIYSDRLGEFDYDNYELRVPGTFGMALPEYEAWKEDEILARQLLAVLSEAVVVTPQEVETLHRLRSTEYDLEFVKLEPDALATLFAVTDDEVDALLTDDRARAEAWFEEHSADFEQPRTLRVRRIFIRLPGEDDPEARAQALARYDEALQLVTDSPESFAEVAAEYSQSTDAERGGDMGVKPAADYLSYPFLEDRLDELEVGEIATYESQVSRIIFRIEEDNPVALPAFDDVAREVARAVLDSERDEGQLRELAGWFLAQARSGMTLEESALEHARQRAARVRLPAPAPSEEAEQPEVSEPSGDEASDAESDETPTEGEAVTETEPGDEADEGEDDDEEEELEPLVEVRRTGLFAIDDPGMDLSQFGPQFAGQFSAPRPPTRIPRIGDTPELARAIAQLTEESPVAPGVYEVEGGYVVARLLERREPPELDDATRELLRDGIWREKTRLLLGDWELRLILHRPAPLGALLRQRLEDAVTAGDAEFNDGYFVEPQQLEPAS